MDEFKGLLRCVDELDACQCTKIDPLHVSRQMLRSHPMRMFQISNDFHSKAVWVTAVFGRDAKHLTENPSVQR